ncbi:MAG: hypothetical protein ABF649_17675 [Bacillus sp. (in: firmicutes)]|uniref:Uncharacterized protein n=1 Tax=Oceanobacillus luteolus TaxID=1274358 RepID=A0ABW4HPY2_9BACI
MEVTKNTQLLSTEDALLIKGFYAHLLNLPNPENNNTYVERNVHL